MEWHETPEASTLRLVSTGDDDFEPIPFSV